MTVFPLFHPRTIEQGLLAFGVPDDLPQRIERFVNSCPAADAPQGAVEWIHDLFVQVLGYRSPFEPEAITWELELHPQICLGFFTEESTDIVAEVFWLGQNQLGGQKPTPSFPSSQWLLSLDRQRLYIHRQDTPFLFCQQFAWDDLQDIGLAQQFYFLLCRRTVLPRTPQGREPSRTQQLFYDSQKYELQTRKTFTGHLSKVRSQLIRDFRYRLLQGMSDSDGVTSMAIAQSEKLLHRILIIATCQGQNLLPANLLSDAYEFVNPYREQPIWENFAAIFRWLHKGHDHLVPPIPPLGCPLFLPDPLLDQALTLGNELCRQLKELAHLLVSLDLSPSAMAFALEASLQELQAIAAEPAMPSTRPARRRSLRAATYGFPLSPNLTEALQQHLTQETPSPFIIQPQCGSGLGLIVIQKLWRSRHTTPLQLFGCDPSPMAIEITKLHLWWQSLITSQTLPDLGDRLWVGTLETHPSLPDHRFLILS